MSKSNEWLIAQGEAHGHGHDPETGECLVEEPAEAGVYVMVTLLTDGTKGEDGTLTFPVAIEYTHGLSTGSVARLLKYAASALEAEGCACKPGSPCSEHDEDERIGG